MSEDLDPSSNGRKERQFAVVPIFRNIRTTSRGISKIPTKCYSGKFMFQSIPHPEFSEFLMEWKAPWETVVVYCFKEFSI